MSDESPTPPASIAVPSSERGARLDRFVATAFSLSRAQVRRLLEAGEVTVDGHPAKGNRKLAGYETVAIANPGSDTDFEPKDGSRDPVVLYESKDVLVVEKPARVSTHPLRPDETGTLVNDLVRAFPEIRGVGYSRREPGIVHRLDRDTSGAVLVARNEATFERLRDSLRRGGIEKHYLALAGGTLDLGDYLGYLGPDAKKKKRVRVASSAFRGARLATTTVLTCETKDGLSYAKVSATAAYRHQVRAHLAYVGHPLAGDTIYHGPAVEGLDRHFLHAASITFDPPGARRIEVKSPLPADLREVLVRTGFEDPPGQ